MGNDASYKTPFPKTTTKQKIKTNFCQGKNTQLQKLQREISSIICKTL